MSAAATSHHAPAQRSSLTTPPDSACAPAAEKPKEKSELIPKRFNVRVRHTHGEGRSKHANGHGGDAGNLEAGGLRDLFFESPVKIGGDCGGDAVHRAVEAGHGGGEHAGD